MARHNSYILFLFAIVFWFGCNTSEEDEKLLLDYSFNSGWIDSYSLKVYANQKAYLMKSNSDSNILYENNRINTIELERLIARLREAKINNKYEDTNLQDASSFSAIIYYEKNKSSKYYVYGNNYPKLLNSIRLYSSSCLKQGGWHKLKDTTIAFASQSKFNVAHRIDTSIRFLPPDTGLNMR